MDWSSFAGAGPPPGSGRTPADTGELVSNAAERSNLECERLITILARPRLAVAARASPAAAPREYDKQHHSRGHSDCQNSLPVHS